MHYLIINESTYYSQSHRYRLGWYTTRRNPYNRKQIKSNQIKIFISINNDDNNRYSTYKGNIVMCIIIHLHTFKYIYTHIYY